MLTFAVEKITDIQPEIQAITPQHWDLLALNKHEIPLDIDWDFYRGVDANGKLHVLTVRNQYGKLVGYYISVINTHPHYKGTLFGFLDCYFIVPEHRTPALGMRFFFEVETEMRRLGVQCVISSTKKHYDLSKLFERCGWNLAGSMFTKYLGAK